MLHKTLQKTFVRYVLVGLISVGVDYGMLLAAYHVFSLDLRVATTVGFLVGLLVNFLLNKFWAFQADHSAKRSAQQGVMVALLVGFNLLVTNIVIVYLHRWNVGPEVSKILTTGMITLWNYVLYKKLIFKAPAPIA